MDEQDKTPWAPTEDDTGVVDLLAGASAKQTSTQPTEHDEQEEAFLPPWMVPEAHEMDAPAASEGVSEAASPEQLKKAIGLAIADVRSVTHGQERARDAASILQGQNLDPKTAAVVATAMASVFSGLSDTRFSAQGPDSKQRGFEGYDDAEKILRNMVSGNLCQGPEAGSPEPAPIGAAEDYSFMEKAVVSAGIEEAAVSAEIVESNTYTSQSHSKPRGGGSRVRTAKRNDERQRQVRGRGQNPYYGVHGRKKPQKIRIASSARAKGMRGQPNLEKTSLNLAVKVKTLSSPSRAIPIFLLTMLLIAAFSKFGVIDQYQRLATVQTELGVLQQESSQIKDTLLDYASVQQQYLLYDDSWLSEQEKLQVDATEVMDLIQRDLAPDKVRLVSVMLTNNELEVNISGIDLSVLAQLLKVIKQEPLVHSLVVQHLSRTDEVPAGGAGAVPPGTFKLIISLGELPPAPSAENGQDPADVPDAGLEQLPEVPPVVPERPVLPGESDMEG